MKHISVIFVSLLLCLTSAAQDWSALPWMRTGRGAADMAMAGSAFMSDDNMAWAADGNAAMVPFSSRRMSVELGYMLANPVRTNYAGAGFAYNIKDRVGVTAALSYGINPAYDVYNESGRPAGTFSPGQLMLGAGVSWRFVKFMSAGLNLRYAMQTLAEGVSSSAFAGDFVLMCRFGDFFVSAGAMNFGTPVKSSDGRSFNLSSSVKLAGMYEHLFAEKHGLQVNLDADWYLSKAASAALGAQYGWNDMVFVRAGYRYGSGRSPLPSMASVGLGCKFFGVRIDAAYVVYGSTINTLNVGLGYSF